MARHGKFIMFDRPIRDKLAYEDLMSGDKEEVTIAEKQWSFSRKNSEESFKDDDY